MKKDKAVENVKKLLAEAHYNMATIYDEAGKVDVAIQHYYGALSYDGETNNLNGQALTLNNIGNMLVIKKEYNKAMAHYRVSYDLLKQKNDKKAQALVLSNIAEVFKETGKDNKALNYYKKSIKLDAISGNISGCAKSFEQSGDIMLRNGKLDKALNLYKKSMIVANQINDESWALRIKQKIEILSN